MNAVNLLVFNTPNIKYETCAVLVSAQLRLEEEWAFPINALQPSPEKAH